MYFNKGRRNNRPDKALQGQARQQEQGKLPAQRGNTSDSSTGGLQGRGALGKGSNRARESHSHPQTSRRGQGGQGDAGGAQRRAGTCPRTAPVWALQEKGGQEGDQSRWAPSGGGGWTNWCGYGYWNRRGEREGSGQWEPTAQFPLEPIILNFSISFH